MTHHVLQQISRFTNRTIKLSENSNLAREGTRLVNLAKHEGYHDMWQYFQEHQRPRMWRQHYRYMENKRMFSKGTEDRMDFILSGLDDSGEPYRIARGIDDRGVTDIPDVDREVWRAKYLESQKTISNQQDSNSTNEVDLVKNTAAGDIAPEVSFAGDIVPELCAAEDIAPEVSFAGDIVPELCAAGDIASEVSFAGDSTAVDNAARVDIAEGIAARVDIAEGSVMEDNTVECGADISSLEDSAAVEPIHADVAKNIRSHSFIIYGLKEAPRHTENLEDSVFAIIKAIGGIPVSEIKYMRRTGPMNPNKVARPVKVQTSGPEIVQLIIKKFYELKEKGDGLKDIYITPDRTPEERVAHSKLVAEMRTLSEQNPRKHYFIRDNKIIGSDKNL